MYENLFYCINFKNKKDEKSKIEEKFEYKCFKFSILNKVSKYF